MRGHGLDAVSWNSEHSIVESTRTTPPPPLLLCKNKLVQAELGKVIWRKKRCDRDSSTKVMQQRGGRLQTSVGIWLHFGCERGGGEDSVGAHPPLDLSVRRPFQKCFAFRHPDRFADHLICSEGSGLTLMNEVNFFLKKKPAEVSFKCI